MSNAKNITQNIFHIKMKIKFLNLLKLCSKINKIFFRIMNDNETTIMKTTTFKIIQLINVNLICNDITKIVHINNLIVYMFFENDVCNCLFKKKLSR